MGTNVNQGNAPTFSSLLPHFFMGMGMTGLAIAIRQDNFSLELLSLYFGGLAFLALAKQRAILLFLAVGGICSVFLLESGASPARISLPNIFFGIAIFGINAKRIRLPAK